MGNRANFVIVKDQDWQLYYSHWAGCRILDALIGGPELALRYAESLRQRAKDQWVDPVWADGGVLVDLDRRRVLFFGDELMVEMAERRALMSALPDLWSGWQAECWQDRFEEQALRCRCALRIPELDLAAGVESAQAWIRTRVFQRSADGPTGQILKLAKLLAPVGPGLVVSGDAVADCAVRPRGAEWARFADACNFATDSLC